MFQCMRFALQILPFLFYVLTVALTCDVGIEVEYEGQEKYCAMNQSTINITVTTPNIELECPSGYDISLTPVAMSVQTGKNTILNGGHLSIQVLRYGHTAEYDCVSTQSDRKISIWIQAIGVGMIIRDRTNDGMIEFHQVLNNSVVYLSCKERDFGILFICESSYQNMRFPLISSGAFIPITPPANTNEFEIASDGVLNGGETVLTCEPKNELGIVQEIVVTVKVTERIPEEDCEGVFPRTTTPNSEDTACLLELGIDTTPVIPCIECSAGWDKKDGVCYRAFDTNNSNWDDAQANCESFGGYLAEVPNYYVNKIVASKANGQQCWIGLRRDADGGYEWRSERKVNEDEFSAWKDGDIGSGSGDCGFMSTSIGEWELKPCDNILQCSVCMKGTIFPPPLSRPQESCEDGVVIANRCYQLFGASLPWKFAQFECELLGSNLIEIPDQNISNLVIGGLNSSGEYWTGLRREDGAADFTWRNGRELEDDGFNSWKDGYPGDMHGCVSADQDIMWQVKPCNDRLGYLCQNGTFNITSQRIQTMQTTDTTVQPTTTMQIGTSSSISATSQQTESLATTTTPTVPKSGEQIKPEDCNEEVIFLKDKCESLQEYEDDITDLDMMIFGDYSEEVERVLLVLVTDLSLNNSEAIRREINETSVVLVNLPTGDTASINLTSSISISTAANSFPSDTTLAALVISSDSDDILQTLSDSTMMFISDICILVSDTELSGTISLIFTYNTALYEDEAITCNFYDNVTSAWSSEGIETVRSGDVIECVTNHFTSFALLVTFQKANSTASETERMIQGYLSMGLCITSIIFLVTSLILYACVGKKFFLRDLNIIHLNYILALMFALVSFLVYSVLFATKTEIMSFNIGCKAIAFLNHYFWLSVFSWNFCEALHIILALYSYKLSNVRHYWWLIIVGWGLPVPIVVTTLGVAYDYYTNMRDNICFLNKERGVIWAFLVPIYFLILVNTGILIFVVVFTVYIQRKRTFKKYICSLLCGTATTLPLLGLPWVAGILPNLAGLLQDNSIAWLSYVFVVVNASQGILFFCIHAIRNDQVLEKLCKLSLHDTNEEIEKNSQNKDINNGTNGNGHKKISKGMRTPNDFSNTTEAGNYLNRDSSTFLAQTLGDLPFDIAIENPTFKNSH